MSVAKLSRIQLWALRIAHRARERGEGWIRYSGDRANPRASTALSLVRLRLAEFRRERGPSNYFRLTLAGCLLAAELQARAEAKYAANYGTRQSPGGTP